MTTVTFTSVPSGAEVELDGEYVGITPCDVEIGEPTTDFRTTCLYNGKVICDWDTLRPYLGNLTVSNLWWELTRDERHSIAVEAIKNTIPYSMNRVRRGNTGCAGGIGEWRNAECTPNGVIRYLAFASIPPMQFSDATACYYKEHDHSIGEFCYVPDKPYHLPCNMVTDSRHTMCGVQIVNNIDSLDNWVVFQWGNYDIKPGDTQMPRGRDITIQRVNDAQLFGYTSTVVTTFTI